MYLAVGGRISYTPNVERIVCWTMCKLCDSVLKTLFLFQLHHAHMRKIPGSPHVHVCILEQGSLGTIQLSSEVPSGLITFRSLCMIPSLCAQHPPPLTPPSSSSNSSTNPLPLGLCARSLVYVHNTLPPLTYLTHSHTPSPHSHTRPLSPTRTPPPPPSLTPQPIHYL